jgi:hypothetical protein
VAYIAEPKDAWDEIEMLSTLEKMRFRMYRLFIKKSRNLKTKELSNTSAEKNQSSITVRHGMNPNRLYKFPQPEIPSKRSHKRNNPSLDTTTYLGSRLSSVDMFTQDLR